MVNISEAKAQLSRLIQDVQGGGRVVIGNNGRPVAVLTAYQGDPGARRLGAWRESDVWVADDFDGPLPDELQALFDGRS